MRLSNIFKKSPFFKLHSEFRRLADFIPFALYTNEIDHRYRLNVEITACDDINILPESINILTSSKDARERAFVYQILAALVKNSQQVPPKQALIDAYYVEEDSWNLTQLEQLFREDHFNIFDMRLIHVDDTYENKIRLLKLITSLSTILHTASDTKRRELLHHLQENGTFVGELNRCAAVCYQAFCKLGHLEALENLKQSIDKETDPVWKSRIMIWTVHCDHNPPSVEHSQQIITLTSKRNALRDDAIRALWRCSHPQRDKILLEILDAGFEVYSYNELFAAFEAVKQSELKEAFPLIIRYLQHPKRDVRFFAISTLSQIGKSAEGVEHLVALVEKDKDQHVKGAALVALTMVNHPSVSKAAISYLKKYMNKSNSAYYLGAAVACLKSQKSSSLAQKFLETLPPDILERSISTEESVTRIFTSS